MDYNILEARIQYKNGGIDRVVVLVEFSKGDVRAIYATTRHRAGYMHIPPYAVVSDEFLQKVAGYGMEADSIQEFFPDWTKNLN